MTQGGPAKPSGDKSQRPLTERERRFVRAYSATGSGSESCRQAGYSGDDHALAVQASKLLRRPAVAAALAEQDEQAERASIATRAERREFWTRVLRGEEPAEMRDRLKASELLGKSKGDFVERTENKTNINHTGRVEIQLPLEEAERILRERNRGTK